MAENITADRNGSSAWKVTGRAAMTLEAGTGINAQVVKRRRKGRKKLLFDTNT
jgi:hypothetical protein